MGMAKRVADLYFGGGIYASRGRRLLRNRFESACDYPQAVRGDVLERETWSPPKFQIRDDKLVMVAPGMTYRLPLGGGSSKPWSPIQNTGIKYTSAPSRSGQEFEVEAWESGAPAIYRAVKGRLWKHRPKRVSGTYSNDDWRRWTLVAYDGKLIRQQWMPEDEELEPAFPDAFYCDLSEGQFLMHFNRDSTAS